MTAHHRDDTAPARRTEPGSSSDVVEVDLSAFGPEVENARAMWAADPASTALGMRAVEVSLSPATEFDPPPTSPSPGPASQRLGRALVRMQVDRRMVNGHEICHGGYLFTLADSAFALACNASGRPTVAAGCDIDFLEPVRLGEVLFASATERVVRGRSGLTDVTVTRESDNRVVAEFRGRSRALPPPRT